VKTPENTLSRSSPWIRTQLHGALKKCFSWLHYCRAAVSPNAVIFAQKRGENSHLAFRVVGFSKPVACVQPLTPRFQGLPCEKEPQSLHGRDGHAPFFPSALLTPLATSPAIKQVPLAGLRLGQSHRSKSAPPSLHLKSPKANIFWHRTHRCSKKTGFSLVEVILAIGVFAFAMVTVFALFSRGMQTSRESRVEGASAILSGQINSLLKASYAWDSNVANNPMLANFLGSRNLGQIAGGSPEIRTNFYTQSLERTTSKDDAEFQVVTEIRPIGQNTDRLAPEDEDLSKAISRLDIGAHCVLVHIEISYPAKASEANRSKRYMTSILTRTTDE